jgi:hypothetical protein
MRIMVYTERKKKTLPVYIYIYIIYIYICGRLEWTRSVLRNTHEEGKSWRKKEIKTKARKIPKLSVLVCVYLLTEVGRGRG